MSTALETPDLVVGEVLDHGEGARVAAEEVLANITTRLRLVGLVVAVGGAVHEVAKRALVVFGEQVIPLTTPNDFDDVPAGATEEAFEFLNDLAVTAYGAVEALQVAVDDEVEVVETVVCRPLEGAAALNLIHLAVAEERPDLLVARVFDATVGEVAVGLRLVDGVDRAETHRHRRELPELGHEARVRVTRQTVGCFRLLLTETVELRFGETALEVGARVHSGGGVTLIEDLVSAT
jgi:hypothetical protein